MRYMEQIAGYFRGTSKVTSCCYLLTILAHVLIHLTAQNSFASDPDLHFVAYVCSVSWGMVPPALPNLLGQRLGSQD
jgi:hypothetical protein